MYFVLHFASHFVSHFISRHFIALTPLLASRILIVLCFKAIKNRGCYASLSCFGGRIECSFRGGGRMLFQVLGKGVDFCPKTAGYLQFVLLYMVFFRVAP